MEQRFVLIGICDSQFQELPAAVLQIIARGKIFSGGRRHHQLMESRLPAGHKWIDVTVPLSDVYAQYAEATDEIVVFVSGDPLFFGFASTLRRQFPGCRLRVFPTFNSLQMLAHRMQLPYQSMRCVSLTGRDWDGLDRALIEGEALIGCLTDRQKTPQAVWERMATYGFTNYQMTVGEQLGNEEAERVADFEPEHAYAFPNCLILQRREVRQRPFGIPESDFHLLDGRVRMITKMPVRLLSLSLLDLRHRTSFWDIGFCTGSVSIEAKLQFPHLRITAFEVRQEGRRLMELNSRRFGTPGIATVIGDFLESDLSQLPRPDAIFVGGHGGRLEEMLCRLHEVALPGATLVFNSVSDESHALFLRAAAASGFTLCGQTRIAIDEHNPITILKATKAHCDDTI